MSHRSWKFLSEPERYHANFEVQMCLKETVHAIKESLLCISSHSRIPFILHIVSCKCIKTPKALFRFDKEIMWVGLLPL